MQRRHLAAGAAGFKIGSLCKSDPIRNLITGL
jgi:hypothetical protein